jgi:hypothetical protein
MGFSKKKRGGSNASDAVQGQSCDFTNTIFDDNIPSSFPSPNTELYKITAGGENIPVSGDSNPFIGSSVPSNTISKTMNWFDGKYSIFPFPEKSDMSINTNHRACTDSSSCNAFPINNDTGSYDLPYTTVSPIVTLSNGSPVDASAGSYPLFSTPTSGGSRKKKYIRKRHRRSRRRTNL